MSKKFGKNLRYAFYPFIILNIFSYIIFNEDPNYFYTLSFKISLCLSIIISILFYLVLEIMELKQEQLDYIEARMGKIIEYFAFGSGKNGNLELIISEIKEKGKIRWLVAKFISQKIKKDFYGEDKTIVIISQDLESFQDLLKYVITDCEKSIYWTCPYKPGEWFDKVDINPEAEEKRKKDERKNLLLGDLPLLKQFSDSSVDKYRFVNLTQSDFDELIGKGKNEEEAKNLLEDLCDFIRINENSIKKCKLIFVNLDEKPEQIKNCLKDKDFGIYDEEVIISYNKNIESFNITEKCLENLRSEDIPEDVLKNLKIIKNGEFAEEGDFLNTLKSIIGDEQTTKYKSMIMKNAINSGQKLGNIALTLGCQKIAPFLEDFYKYKINSDRGGFYTSKQILKKFNDETKKKKKE